MWRDWRTLDWLLTWILFDAIDNKVRQLSWTKQYLHLETRGFWWLTWWNWKRCIGVYWEKCRKWGKKDRWLESLVCTRQTKNISRWDRRRCWTRLDCSWWKRFEPKIRSEKWQISIRPLCVGVWFFVLIKSYALRDQWNMTTTFGGNISISRYSWHGFQWSFVREHFTTNKFQQSTENKPTVFRSLRSSQLSDGGR